MTLNVANNGIDEVRLLVAFDADRIFGVSNLILDGNIFIPRTYYKLAALLAHAQVMKRVSFSKCNLGDEGFNVTFEALQMLRKLTKIDYSNNNIFDRGQSRVEQTQPSGIYSSIRSCSERKE